MLYDFCPHEENDPCYAEASWLTLASRSRHETLQVVLIQFIYFGVLFLFMCKLQQNVLLMCKVQRPWEVFLLFRKTNYLFFYQLSLLIFKLQLLWTRILAVFMLKLCLKKVIFLLYCKNNNTTDRQQQQQNLWFCCNNLIASNWIVKKHSIFSVVMVTNNLKAQCVRLSCI